MKNQGSKNTIIFLKKFISEYEKKKFEERNNRNNIGIVFTPKKIADFIISNIFRIYLVELFNIQIDVKNGLFFEELSQNLSKNQKLREKIKKIKILDPSCGSGRFLESIANYLLKIFKLINPNVPILNLKNQIIQNNLYGIDIDKVSCDISKLRLFTWLYSNETEPLNQYKDTAKNIKTEEIDSLFEKFSVDFNIYNTDFLLEFEQKEINEFDLIIGNPPYIENKKLKDFNYKKKLKRFKSAYKLFDLSVVFIEKSIQLLKEKGYLSFIVPNKFLAADYGIKIRELLINNTEIREIINISSVPIFHKSDTYPIIISLKKGKLNENTKIIIKKFDNIEDLIRVNSSKSIVLPQKLIEQLPSKVIPISGNIDIIRYLFTNYKTMSETFEDLKIIYRPFGFLKYSKHFDNISEEKNSNNDLILIGTGNVEKYHIKFNKRIKIVKKDLKISYFNYKPAFEDIWSKLSSEKILIREIAKELTCVYDPGVFANITGLYIIKIPSLSTQKLYSFLTIMNSNLMNLVFKTLFGTLHMSGGYMRFNGSFIKRLPMPKEFPNSLNYLGRINQFLSQLIYDYNSGLIEDKEINITEIGKYSNFFKELTNSLVEVLFLKDFDDNDNQNHTSLKQILYSKNLFPEIQVKYNNTNFSLPKFEIYQKKERTDNINKISALFNILK